MVIRLLFRKQHTLNIAGKRHSCTCCVTWLSWIVFFLYTGACAFIVGYTSINGLFTQDSDPTATGSGSNSTARANGTVTADATLADMAAEVTTCKIKETSDFAAEWAILIATSCATWAFVTRPISITIVFCLRRLNIRRQNGKAAAKGRSAEGTPAGVRTSGALAEGGLAAISEGGPASGGDTSMIEMPETKMRGARMSVSLDDLGQNSVQYDNPMRVQNGGSNRGERRNETLVTAVVTVDINDGADLDDESSSDPSSTANESSESSESSVHDQSL